MCANILGESNVPRQRGRKIASFVLHNQDFKLCYSSGKKSTGETLIIMNSGISHFEDTTEWSCPLLNLTFILVPYLILALGLGVFATGFAFLMNTLGGTILQVMYIQHPGKVFLLQITLTKQHCLLRSWSDDVCRKDSFFVFCFIADDGFSPQLYRGSYFGVIYHCSRSTLGGL